MNAPKDADLIEEAFGNVLKEEFTTLFYNTVSPVPGTDPPAARFQRGLAILRTCRDTALELVKE